MPKTCNHENCSYPVFSKSLCVQHWRVVYGKPIKQKVAPTAPNKRPKPRKIAIALISKTRQEALKRYRRLRDKYFEEHPVCEFPDCHSKDITLHHMRGRTGAFLTDKRYFKSLCPKHHRYVEENPLEAQKLGLSQKRLDK